jgi:hypothetical protein
MKKEIAEIILTIVSLLSIIAGISLILLIFKYRDLETRYAELAVTCKRLETRQVKVYSDTPVYVEPSDDEIIITVGNAFDR